MKSLIFKLLVPLLFVGSQGCRTSQTRSSGETRLTKQESHALADGDLNSARLENLRAEEFGSVNLAAIANNERYSYDFRAKCILKLVRVLGRPPISTTRLGNLLEHAHWLRGEDVKEIAAITGHVGVSSLTGGTIVIVWLFPESKSQPSAITMLLDRKTSAEVVFKALRGMPLPEESVPIITEMSYLEFGHNHPPNPEVLADWLEQRKP